MTHALVIVRISFERAICVRWAAEVDGWKRLQQHDDKEIRKWADGLLSLEGFEEGFPGLLTVKAARKQSSPSGVKLPGRPDVRQMLEGSGLEAESGDSKLTLTALYFYVHGWGSKAIHGNLRNHKTQAIEKMVWAGFYLAAVAVAAAVRKSGYEIDGIEQCWAALRE